MMYWFKRIQGVKWVGIFVIAMVLIAWSYGSQENQATSGGVVWFKGRTLPNTPSGGNETDQGWYFKPGYPDYAINGMPDFSQKQGGWFVSSAQGRVWTHCGPVALGNCLWWFDSKFEPGTIQPPTFSDGYPLVSSYGTWDDHATQNVIPYVNQLAGYVYTGTTGTNVDSLYHGVINYLIYKGLINDYTVNLYPRPSTELVCSEVLRSQDVILLLGFWELSMTGGWHRIGGHYVTVAGVDSNCSQIAFSDPFFDWAEYGNPVRIGNGILIPHSPIPGHGAGVHNDAGNISHDGYIISSPSPSPGGSWWLPEYPITFNPDSVWRFTGLNCPTEFQNYQGTWQGGLIRTEVEYALIICPIVQRELDFGDAPDPTYPSLLINNGARHQNFSFEWLGDSVDGEGDSRQVDLDNFDDGVIFYPPYTSGGTGQVDLIVSVSNPFSGRYSSATPIYLHGWFDWLGDGDWNDPGENVFSGVMVYPSMWPAGQTQETVTITFTIPAGIAIPDSIWTRFRLDYAQNLNADIGLANFGEVEDHLLVYEGPPPEWYFKPGYPDYAPNGMPDFDQKQAGWFVPGGPGPIWIYCGPVALANCLWWFDSKFETGTIPPPTISDHYNLVTAYGAWDDHDTSNVVPFVNDLSSYISTGSGGTEVHQMYYGVQSYLNHVGLSPYYTVSLYPMPQLELVCSEVLRSQDVILLLGFWESLGTNEWQRVGGHYVTMAGIDSVNCDWVAFSDPYINRAENGYPVRVLSGSLIPHTPIPGHSPIVHNDAGNISHDGYRVMLYSPSPGGVWAISGYPAGYMVENFTEQNCPNEFQQQQGPYLGGPIHVEVEYALIICPTTPREMDYGDAPDPTYPSLLASNGARHANPTFEWLGDSVDVETDSRQVDLDNFDDGVIFHPPYTPGTMGQVDVIVSASNPHGGRYSPNMLIYLHGWFDWNGDGDWDDTGDNVFCGVTVDPSQWNATQTRDTVNITFMVPSYVVTNDTIWTRFRLDYAQNLNADTGFANFGEVEDYWYYQAETPPPPPPEHGWYYKPGYPDFCNFGMPDFDQKQDSLGNYGILGWQWSWCGPTAVANCLWWFDSKYQFLINPTSPPPPAIHDDFNLVTAYSTNWDDHAPQNVLPLLNDLGSRMSMNTLPWPGTTVDTVQSAIQNWLIQRNLANVFYEHTVRQPSFDEVCYEVGRSQDVILLIGFYGYNFEQQRWCRFGGHFVTVGGVNADSQWIALSDPYFDRAEGDPPPPHGPTVHNNADSVSGPHFTNWHDRYPVYFGGTVFGSWKIGWYPLQMGPIDNFIEQNFTAELWSRYWCLPPTWPTHAEVEYAIMVSPYEPDFGDAPDPTYPSLLVNNGARHLNFNFEWMGDSVNGELDSRQINADNFDDGVVFYPPYITGGTGQVDVIVSASNPMSPRYSPNSPIYIHGWIDFNGDGDWNDAGENIFCGVAVDPSTWPAGQNQETVSIAFTIPSGGIAIGDTIWSRFRLDYNQNLNSVFGAAQFGEVEDYPLIIECPEPPDEGWYYKPGYPDYCDYGIPDFDQKQTNWYVGTSPNQKWTHCGPVAVANCLWWFDSKFQYWQNPLSPPPPAISDDFPLVPQFGNWDDHSPSNVRPLVQNMASFAHTNVGGLGTNVDSLANGIQHLLDISGLEHFNVFDVRVVQRPNFWEVHQEVMRSQDVILLLGFWALDPTGAWCRYGGHYVTTAGVWAMPSDQGEPWIAISDPFFDHAEGGPPSPHGTAMHNNADSVSGPHWTNWHDRYMVNLESPSPGGYWGLVCYPMNFNYIKNFFGQNANYELMQWQCQDSLMVPTNVEVEYAIIMCPTPEYEDLDFGDAPDPTYPSLLLSNGARHFDYSHEWLGAGVNGELESNQVDADLLDDGVIFHPPYTPGNAGTVDLIVSVVNPTDVRYDTARIYLHGWFDWNQDGDWNDTGENIFSGYTVDPNTWFAGQTCDTVSVTFIVPANAVLSDTFWTRFRLDYAENLNSVVGAAQFGEVEDHFLRQELPHGFYFKPPYPNYAPMGMPDFDQKQDTWISPMTEAWTFCGPVAIANCFWWFDSKYDILGMPGDGFDQFPLVRDYLDALPPLPPPMEDDHCFNNVNDLATSWFPVGPPPALPPFVPGFQAPPLPIPPWGELVERLAWFFDTDGWRTGVAHSGTNVFEMQNAIQQWLVRANIDRWLYEHTIGRPTLDTIRFEVRRSQDVILLLGFWEFQLQPVPPQWVRLGGHYVTIAGVDTLGNWIAVSDPYFDQAVAGFPGNVTLGHPPYGTYTSDFHNDAQWISHDYYHVLPNSESPGGEWYLPEYPVTLFPSQYWWAFMGQNSPNLQPPQTVEWMGGPIHTEIEYAVVISPHLHELDIVIQRDSTNTYIQLVWDPIPTSQGYRIYRSTVPIFTPSPATYITTVPKTQTQWTDPDVNLPLITTERYFYRIIVKY